MRGYYEESTFIDGGIKYPFKTFVQTARGRSQMVEAHYHHSIEILYCLKGVFKVFLNGASHEFSQGDLVLINAMEVHSVIAIGQALNEYIVIRFEPEMLYTTAQSVFEARYVLPFTMKDVMHQRVFKQDEIAQTDIPSILHAIIEEDHQRTYGFELAIRTHLSAMFLWILRNWHQKGVRLNLKTDLNPLMMERLQKAFAYVDKHYDQAITLAEVAKHCQMSYSYFSRFFKETMGRNFSQYLNDTRVSKSEHLLITSQMSVTEIAVTVGFSTTSYYIEQFKVFKNMTPLKFRERFLKMVSE